MEENITTIEELNATIAALNEENAELKNEVEELRKLAEAKTKDADLYRGWYSEATVEKNRIKGCMQAIATLLEAIK